MRSAKLFISSVLFSASLLAPAMADTFTLNNNDFGDGYVTPLTNGGFDLFGSDNGSGENLTSYLATASANETLTFRYAYTTNDCCGSAYDPAGYVLNDVYTQLSIDSALSIGSSGLITFSVSAGQDYGFYVYTTDGVLGRGDIAVRSGVPELSTWAMMMIGFAGFGYSAYRKARKQVAEAVLTA